MSIVENGFAHAVQPGDPVMIITVVRSSIEQLHSQQHYCITPRGVVGSLRDSQNGEVFIGRQQINEQGHRPNDIILPANDRAISRSHCKILCGMGFPTRRIPDEWISFLMAEHPRLGARSVFQQLPQPIFAHILSFIKEPRAFWLVDLGSVCGTYLKVSHTDPAELSEGQTFLVGNDINIDIENVTHFTNATFTESSEDSLSITLRDSELPKVRLTISKVPVDNEDVTINSQTYCFIAEQLNKTITLGRSQTCDVLLADSTISRTQCRIVFAEGKWLLYDGCDVKNSVNGTWLSVCRKNRGAREHSHPYPIHNES